MTPAADPDLDAVLDLLGRAYNVLASILGAETITFDDAEAGAKLLADIDATFE